jgi:integrase
MKSPKKSKPITLGKVKTYLTGGQFTLSWYADGIRKREKRSTFESAKSRAEEINRDLDNGRGHVRSFTTTETAVINSCIEQLREIGIPISQVVREYVAAHRILEGKASIEEAVRKYTHDRQKADLTPIKFDDVATEFMARCERNNLSEAYKTATKKFLRRVSPSLGQSLIQDITSREIDKVVESLVDGGPRAFNNLLGAVAGVFSYARKQGYLPRTEKTEAEIVERKSSKRIEKIGVYSPEEIHTILGNIGEELVPFIALGAFAGIRTEEIFRMNWEMIDLKKGFILLDRKFTKTHRRRIIPINQALRSWIAPLHKKTGAIYNFRSSHELGNALRAAWPRNKDGEMLVERRRNALRHSYGTYRFAELQDEQKVSSEMGNSPNELREHYAELATPEDASAWFSIHRDTPANIIAIKTAA